MVTISQKDFNEGMDRYLERLTKKSSKSFVERFQFMKKPVNEPVPELSEQEVHIEYKEPSFFKRILRWRRKYALEEDENLTAEEKVKLEEMEGEIESLEEEEADLEEMQEEVEERKAGLLARFFDKLNIFKTGSHFEEELDSMEEEEFVPEFDEDVKEVLKITHTWIEKLSPAAKKKFKASNDFKRYKEILAKYGLIKK